MLNRCNLNKENASWISSLKSSREAQYVLYSEEKFLSNINSAYTLKMYSLSDLKDFNFSPASAIFVGESEGVPYFSLSVPATLEVPEAEWVDLKSLTLNISPLHTEIALITKALFYWHQTVRFCSTCAHMLSLSPSGFIQNCSICNKSYFPVITPAVIVLVTCGKEVLLARPPHARPKFYSALAGFVEVGENAEATAIRETWEEVGLTIENVKYVASQSWPFPNSLMLGFTAETADKTIRFIDEEIEDARWYTRRGLRAAEAKGEIILPYAKSLSYLLIQNWLNAS